MGKKKRDALFQTLSLSGSESLNTTVSIIGDGDRLVGATASVVDDGCGAVGITISIGINGVVGSTTGRVPSVKKFFSYFWRQCLIVLFL